MGRKSFEFKAFIADCDALIRQGRASEVRLVLQRSPLLNAREALPREFVKEIAALERRTGSPDLAVRRLHRWTHPRSRLPKTQHATTEEWIEYAASLAQIGAHREALQILSRGDIASKAQAAIFRGFAHQHQWEYESAAEAFMQAYESKELSDYERLIAGVNLSASLAILGDVERYPELRDELLRHTEERGYVLLHGNVLGHKAEALVHQGRHSEAKDVLNFAEKRLQKSGSYDWLRLKKWSVIAELWRQKASSQTLEALDEVRRIARAQRQFETVRDCDFHQAVVTSDRELALCILAGTPHSKFRERLRRRFQGELPGEFVFYRELGLDFAKRQARVIDLRDGAILRTPLMRFLFELLNCDFYRPLRMPHVYAELFPKRYFNPDSSPLAVHQLLHRLRATFQREGLELEVRSRRGFVELISPMRVQVVLDRGPVSAGMQSTAVSEDWNVRAHLQLNELRERLGHKPDFARADVVQVMSCSPRKAASLLSEALKVGWLRREGAGSGTRYAWMRELFKPRGG